MLTCLHQREMELVNMRQTIYMVSMLQICLRSFLLLLLLKISWRRDSAMCRQPLPRWSKLPRRPDRKNVVAPNRFTRLLRIVATIVRLSARAVAVKQNQPARRDRKPTLMNTACVPPRTKREIAYLPNLRRKSGQSPEGAQGNASPIVLGQ